MQSKLPVDESSTLAEYARPAPLCISATREPLPLTNHARCARRLRAFVKDNNLDIKTGGKGRNKATIFADLQRVWGEGEAESVAAPPPAAPAPPVPEPAPPAAEPVAKEEPPAPEEEAAAAQAPEPAAPDGFEWGLTL